MTNPPHDGDEQGTGGGAPRPDPDQQRTQPVPFHDGSAPSPYGPPTREHGQAPYGQAPYGQAPYGQAPYGQAPYGQPGYDPAPYGQAGPQASSSGATRRRRSRLKLYLQLAALAALLALAMVLANVLGPTVLDRAAVERDVAAQFEEREGVAIDLTCDAEMRVEDGESYTCTGVTADREDVELRITITDENFAEYTWDEP